MATDTQARKKQRLDGGSQGAQALHKEVLGRMEAMDESTRNQFMHLMTQTLDKYATPPSEERLAGQETLEQIQRELRAQLAADCMAPQEEVVYPKDGAFADYTPQNTVHMDNFLYSDEDLIDEMEQEGKISRYYCTSAACGHSRSVARLNIISHSFSEPQMQFIFEEVLRGGVSEATRLLDVGSRTGALLYYAALFTPIGHVVGIERNNYFAALQQRTVAAHGLQKRVRVVEGDILGAEGAELIAASDVVVMHNVFEWFCADQTASWKKIRRCLTKKGTVLITVPALEEVVNLNKAPFKNWVEAVPLRYPQTPGLEEGDEEPDDDFEAARSIHKYVVV